MEVNRLMQHIDVYSKTVFGFLWKNTSLSPKTHNTLIIIDSSLH